MKISAKTVTDYAHARAWLESQGYPVGKRGKIPNQWLWKYESRDEEEPVELGEEYRALPTGTTNTRPYFCGFCDTGDHQYCPGTIRNGRLAPKPYVRCMCFVALPEEHPIAKTYDWPL